MQLHRTQSHRMSAPSRPQIRVRFSDALLATYPGRGEYFIEQLPQFNQLVIENVLAEPRVNKGTATKKIWHANAYPNGFCKGVNQIRLCAWLASTTPEEIQKYADFLSEPKDDHFSMESVIEAKRMVVMEARFRRIWINLPRTVSIGAPIHNPLMATEVAERIKSGITNALDTKSRIDLLSKRLVRQYTRVTADSCRLILMDDDLSAFEASELIRKFIDGHLRNRKKWDGMRIQFPHRPNASYRDDAWAYFVVLIRFLRAKEHGPEFLELLAEDVAAVRNEQPENVEVRSLARAMASLMRAELSGRGGEIYPMEYPEVETPEIQLSADSVWIDTVPTVEVVPVVETSQPQVELQAQAQIPVPVPPVVTPVAYPVRKERKVETPEPLTVGYSKYKPLLPRTRLRLNRRKGNVHAELLRQIIALTENGDRPMMVNSLPDGLGENLAWLMDAYGVDMETGGELVHQSTGVRFVLDRSGGVSKVWAWSPFSNERGEVVLPDDIS